MHKIDSKIVLIILLKLHFVTFSLKSDIIFYITNVNREHNSNFFYR